MNQKGLAPVLIIVLLAVAALGGYFIYQQQIKPNLVACTMDAKICPDGSAVSRTSPKCEFAPCPTSQSSPTPSDETANPDSIGANWKTYTNKQLGFSLKYPPNWKVDINCNGQGSVYTRSSGGGIKYIDSPCFTTPDFKQGPSGLSEGGLISGGVVIIAQDREHVVKTSLEQFCTPTGDYPKLSDCQKIKIGQREIVRRNGTQFALYTLAGIIDSDQVISGFSAYYDQKSEEETIQTLEQILSTFRFLDQLPGKGEFCGGIAGLPCPSGYKCILDGNYPDAGGKCVKE